jgi:hypothetical protein
MLKVDVATSVKMEAPSPAFAAEAAAEGVAQLLIRHFRDRNNRPASRPGWPRSNYWADAADSVRWGDFSADSATVVASAPGLRLRLHGGTVRPTGGKKYIAIPQVPRLAGVWPSEHTEKGGELIFIPRANGKAILAERSGADGALTVLYRLLPQTTHKPDPTVLPEQSEIDSAAAAAAAATLKKN